MKKAISLLATIFFVLINLSAQNLEWNTQPEPISSVNAVLPAKDNGWVIGGSAKSPYLIAIDSVGNSIWGDANVGVGLITGGSIDQLEYNSDTSFYFIGETPATTFGDFVIPGKLFFQHQHCNGQILNRVDFDFIIGDQLFSDFTAFDILPDQSIVVATIQERSSGIFNSKIAEIATSGEVEWYKQLDNSAIYDIIMLENEGYLLATNRGILKFDENHFLTQNALISESILQIEKVGTTFISILTDSEIILLDNNLDFVNDFSFSEVDYFSDQFIDDQNFYFTGKDKNNLPFVLKLDENLNQQLYFTFGHSKIFPKEIIFHDGQIGIGGQVKTDPESIEILNGSSGGSMFFKTFDETGFSTDYGEDVAITNIEIGSAKGSFSFSGDGLCDIDFQNVKIAIENLGLDTLKELKINYFEGFTERQQQKIFNLQIPPSETANITLPRIEIKRVIVHEDDMYNLCLWTSVPDKKIDVNFENNSFCKEIVIEKEGAPSIENFGFFPNPTSRYLNFNQHLLPYFFKISISNTMGQNVYVRKTEFEFDYVGRINVSNLSPGIYFLNIQTDEDSKSFPFFKL